MEFLYTLSFGGRCCRGKDDWNVVCTGVVVELNYGGVFRGNVTYLLQIKWVLIRGFLFKLNHWTIIAKERM